MHSESKSIITWLQKMQEQSMINVEKSTLKMS